MPALVFGGLMRGRAGDNEATPPVADHWACDHATAIAGETANNPAKAGVQEGW